MRRLIMATVIAAGCMYAQPSCAPTNVRCVGSGQEYTVLQTAVDAAVAGDLVYVFNTYSGAGYKVVSPHVSGTSGSPITIQAQSTAVSLTSQGDTSGDGIDIDTVDWIVVDGFEVTGQTRYGIRVVGANHVTIKNNLVHGNAADGILTGFARFVQILSNTVYSNGTTSGQHGIYVANSDTGYDGPVIRGNTVHDNHGNGIQINGDCFTLNGSGFSTGVITGALVEQNTVYANGAHAMQAIDMQTSIVRDNVFYNNGNDEFVFTDNDGCNVSNDGNLITFNTVVSDAGKVGIRVTQPAANNAIWGNAIVTTGYTCVDSSGPDTCSTTFTGNNHYQVGWIGNPTSAASGVFTDYASHDYSLASGSPAIGVGGASFQGYASPAIDILGNGRPVSTTYDAGAYEFGGSPASPGTPTTPSSAVHTETAYVINLSWTASTDTSGIRGYYIYRDSVLYAASIGVSYSDSVVTPGTSYAYSVTAFNFSGTESSALSFGSITVPGITGCLNTDNLTWRNKLLPTLTGTHTIEGDVTPSTGVNGTFAASPITAGAYTELSPIVLFSSSGVIQARNGASYTADVSQSWSAGLAYHVRMVINIAAQTYNVYITPPASGEITLATGYSFRKPATILQNVVGFTDTGTLAICSAKLDGALLSTLTIIPVMDTDRNTTYAAAVGTGQPVFNHPPPVLLTADYILTANDSGKMFYTTGSSTITVTVPSGLGDGFGAAFLEKGSGVIAFTGTHSSNNATHTTGANTAASVQCLVSDYCYLWGMVAQ